MKLPKPWLSFAAFEVDVENQNLKLVNVAGIEASESIPTFPAAFFCIREAVTAEDLAKKLPRLQVRTLVGGVAEILRSGVLGSALVPKT